MAYRFSRRDRTLTAGVRRIAAELIDAAAGGLDETGRPLAPRIHDGRKAVKKLRGLIRLVRPGFAAYRAENAALGAAGRTIAALRDAAVQLAAFDALAAALPPGAAPPVALAPLRAPFAARRAAAEDPAALAASVAAFRAGLQAVRARLPDWKVTGRGFDAAEAGLARTLKAAQAAMAAAADDDDLEALHDWRKRVKDRGYQARLLRPVWPALMDPEIAAAGELGEMLGEHRDLAVLAARLRADGAGGDAAEALLHAAGQRQAALMAAARPLARRLLAGRPADQARRWRQWWEVWRGS
jgi:CHAD domain-containing protein